MIRPLFENIGWRLFSILAATLLWATFVGSPELVTSIYAPIEYRRMPADLEISSEVVDRVFLEIQGPSARLHSFDLTRTSVVLDLSSVKEAGEHTFTIDSSAVDLPPGLKVVRAVPSQVRLTFERSVSAEIPVRPRFASDPPPGYRIVSHNVEPPRVRIVGPESRVKRIDHAETDPIDISKVVGQKDFRVQTYVDDKHVRLQSSPTVKVTVVLEAAHR